VSFPPIILFSGSVMVREYFPFEVMPVAFTSDASGVAPAAGVFALLSVCDMFSAPFK
jgi:hypothetical protein